MGVLPVWERREGVDDREREQGGERRAGPIRLEACLRLKAMACATSVWLEVSVGGAEPASESFAALQLSTSTSSSAPGLSTNMSKVQEKLDTANRKNAELEADLRTERKRSSALKKEAVSFKKKLSDLEAALEATQAARDEALAARRQMEELQGRSVDSAWDLLDETGQPLSASVASGRRWSLRLLVRVGPSDP